MLSSLLLGSGFAFAAAIQPGPLQAYLLSSVAQRGWKRTLPAALSPLLSDGPIILIALLVLTRLPDTAARLLQAAGGLLLLYFAWSGYREWRRGPSAQAEATTSAPRTLLEAAGVNLLNPNPWLGWSLILGPALLSAWHQGPASAAALLISFYGVIVTMTALIILLFGTTRFLSPRLRHSLILVSAIVLAALGLYRLVSSLLTLA
jgi:threonine/homoserine/homoserine lactone efflux protein